jgi:hypothetical protein
MPAMIVDEGGVTAAKCLPLPFRAAYSKESLLLKAFRHTGQGAGTEQWQKDPRWIFPR